MNLSLEALIRTVAFLTLFCVLAPGQIYVQTQYYAGLSGPSLMRIVMQAMGAGLCMVEALALPLITAALRRGEWLRPWPFAVTLLLIMVVTFAADVGAISAHLEADRSARLEQRAQWHAAQQDLADTEADIAAFAAALPAIHRGKTVEALTIEHDGIVRRIAAYASPPPIYVRTEIQLASALATRRALDESRLHRDRLREALISPPPEADHPQIAALRQAATLFGYDPSPAMLRAAIAMAFVLTVKFTTMFGFWVTTPNAQHVKAKSSIQAPTQIATPPSPATQTATVVAPPTPTLTAGASQGAAQPRTKGKGAPKIAKALQHALRSNGAGSSP